MSKTLNTHERQEFCLGCHACCKALYIPIDRSLLDKEATEFYLAHGCTFTTQQGRLSIVVPSVCAQLTFQGCKIYSARPKACRDWDGRQDLLLNNVCLWKEKNRG